MSKIWYTLLLFFSLHRVFSLEIYNQERDDNRIKYFKNLLTFYRGFDKIFHVDRETYNVAQYLSAGNKLSLQIMVYNHDSNQTLQRPIGGDILNIFFFKDVEKITRYLKDYSNISGRDVLMMITCNRTFSKELPADLHIKHRHGAGNLLILNFNVEDIELFHICQYCGNSENRIMDVQKTNTSKVQLNPTLIWPNSFRHFYGNKFTILFNQYFPFMHCLKYVPTIHLNKTYNRCIKWVGSEGMLLDTLSKTMNFSYDLIALTEYITVSKILPFINRNKKIDFAIGGIGLSATRIKKFLFSRMTNYENFVVMYKIHTGWQDRVFAFSNALSSTIWCFIGFTSLVVSTGMYAFIKISTKGRNSLTFLEFLLVPPRIMIEQPVFKACLTKNIKTTVLIVSFCWMFGCIEFNTIYKSSLASQIIHPPVELYKNVYELVRNGYSIGMEQEKTPFLDILLNSKHFHGGGKIKEKFFNVSVLCSTVPRVLKERVALSGEKSFLKYHCQTNYQKSYAYEVNYTPEPLSVVTHGWLFRKGAPFVDAFNEKIMRIQASGLMAKWLRDVLWQKKRFFNTDEQSEGRVKLEEFTSHFTLYTIGITLAFIAFFCEHIRYYFEKKRQKIRNFKDEHQC